MKFIQNYLQKACVQKDITKKLEYLEYIEEKKKGLDPDGKMDYVPNKKAVLNDKEKDDEGDGVLIRGNYKYILDKETMTETLKYYRCEEHKQ